MLAVRRALAAVVLAAFAGCSGGSEVPGNTPTRAGPAGVRSVARVEFRLRIPRKHRTGRSPRFVSPATQSIGITVDPGPNQTVLNANLTPGSPSCAGNVCTLSLDLAPGAHIFDVRTYDEPLSGGVPQGSLLSENLGFPFRVAAGGVNSVAMVLEGVAAGIAIAQLPGEDVQGDAQSGFNLYGGYKVDGSTIYPRIFNVVATDADGNLIVGAGAPSLSVTSSNTAIFSSGVASPSNPNAFTIEPVLSGGFFNSAVVPFTATAGSASVTFRVQIAAQIAPRIYVTQQDPSKLWVFDEEGNPVPSLQSNLDAIDFGGPVGAAYFPLTGSLWVAGEFSQSVQEVRTDGTAGNTISTTPYEPLGVACDNTNYRLYIGLAGAPVGVFSLIGTPSQIATSGTWKEVLSGAVPSTPWDLLLENGNVELTDEATSSINYYDTNGNASSEYTGTGSAPVGIAELPGSVIPVVTSRQSNSIYDFGGLTFPGGFPNLSSPFGISYDAANGDVYVSNYGNSTITRYDTGGNQIALQSGAFAGLSNPLHIVVVP